ncbi:50S ribosomal protein L25 [Candidatus Omnitrophota bacterium]
MEKHILKADVREGTGKSAAKKLRNQGLIPAVVYKAGKSTTSLKVSLRELEKILHTKAGENALIMLKVSGASKKVSDKTVIIKELQHDPVKDNVLHADFNEISLTEALKVDVPLVFKGEPVGVKEEGGVIEHVIRDLHIECLPVDIPEGVEVEVSQLKIGDSIMVKDVAVPPGLKVLNEPDLIVAIVKTPHVEKPVEEVEGEEAAEPELIKKERKEGEEEEEEAPKEAPKQEKKQDKKEEK